MSDKDIPNKLLVIIGGPTGIGKTAMSIRLAQHFHTEILSADSRQVYKELNIGVGKPSAEDFAMVKHHLIGHASVLSHYSAGHFASDALPLLESLFRKHDMLIMTGGTGLYLKSIMTGFDEMPEVPEEVNAYWTKVWNEKGINELLIILQDKDPDYFEIVDRSNPMRLIRAVSFIMHTGYPFSAYHKGKSNPRSFRILPIALEMPRNELYERINVRVLKMMENGWMEEAQSLYPSRHLKALQTVGYKELFEVIEGNMKLEEAIPLIQQSTRQYAKRQMTWWRNQGEWHHIKADDFESIIDLIDDEKKIKGH